MTQIYGEDQLIHHRHHHDILNKFVAC